MAGVMGVSDFFVSVTSIAGAGEGGGAGCCGGGVVGARQTRVHRITCMKSIVCIDGTGLANMVSGGFKVITRGACLTSLSWLARIPNATNAFRMGSRSRGRVRIGITGLTFRNITGTGCC